MKKLITGVIAAAAILFGFASCAGDLHDVDTSPFSATKSVFLIGGIADSTVDASQYLNKVTSPANGFEVALTNGSFSFEFTYVSDGWGADAGAHAFTIMSNVDGGWDGAIARWGNGTVENGGSGEITLSGENIKLTGLSAGTKYTLTGSLTAAGGTLSLSSEIVTKLDDPQKIPTTPYLYGGIGTVQLTKNDYKYTATWTGSKGSWGEDDGFVRCALITVLPSANMSSPWSSVVTRYGSGKDDPQSEADFCEGGTGYNKLKSEYVAPSDGTAYSGLVEGGNFVIGGIVVGTVYDIVIDMESGSPVLTITPQNK